MRQSRSPDLPVGRSACGCEGSAPQAAPVQSLAAENLLCSFPAPRRSAAKARTAPAAAPRSSCSSLHFPHSPHFPHFPHGQSGRARAGCWRRGPGAGREASWSPFTPPRDVSKGGSFSPLAVFQKKGAGKEDEKLAEGLGKAARPRCDIAERSRGRQQGPCSRCNVFYILFLKVSVKLAGLFVVRCSSPRKTPAHLQAGMCPEVADGPSPARVPPGPNCFSNRPSLGRFLTNDQTPCVCLFI